MALVHYDPRPTEMETAGNTALWLLPTVADATLATVTTAEIGGGQAFECATDSFGLKPSVKARTSQNLCDKDVRTKPGPTSWSIDSLTVDIGDPQAENLFLEGLVDGETRYIVQRDGLPHLDGPAAVQKVMIAEVSISKVYRAPLKVSTDGATYKWMIDLTVVKVNQFGVIS